MSGNANDRERYLKAMRAVEEARERIRNPQQPVQEQEQQEQEQEQEEPDSMPTPEQARAALQNLREIGLGDLADVMEKLAREIGLLPADEADGEAGENPWRICAATVEFGPEGLVIRNSKGEGLALNPVEAALVGGSIAGFVWGTPFMQFFKLSFERTSQDKRDHQRGEDTPSQEEQ